MRALRKARGLTLADLAAALDRSVGWMSQVERDMSAPSINDLRAIAQCLDVPVSMLFGQPAGPAHEVGFVVRKTARRPLGSGDAGLIEELLSPDFTDDFEVVHSTFEAGAELAEPVSRPTQELGYLLSGRLDIEIDGRWHQIETGDSFRIKGHPFRWSNPYPDPAVALWVIAPPVY